LSKRIQKKLSKKVKSSFGYFLKDKEIIKRHLGFHQKKAKRIARNKKESLEDNS
jgi:hypothetical protein